MPSQYQLNLTDYIREIPDFPKPGILFRDITPLLGHYEAFRQAVCQLADAIRPWKVDVVAAAEARGFLFAAPLALELSAGLVPVRKKGKLPYQTMSHTYDLEYGKDTLEIHADSIPRGANVVVVDDLLATGGTVQACCELAEKAGGRVVGCAFLIELAGLEGAKRIQRYHMTSLIKYDGA
jgi:adenine phosphoribosyltransferase